MHFFSVSIAKISVFFAIFAHFKKDFLQNSCVYQIFVVILHRRNKNDAYF